VALGVAIGVFEQDGPACEAGGGDGHPFSKPTPGGGKGKALSREDERFHVARREFDNQVLGAGVPGGEDVAAEA
jgi:hypothetical protein